MTLLHKLTFRHNILRRNAVFGSGIAAVPAIAAATNLGDAAVLAAFFTLLLLPSALLCALIPRKLVYSVRVVIYAIVASAVYIPVFLLLNGFVPRINEPMFAVYLCIGVCSPILLARVRPRGSVKDNVTLAAAEVGGLLAGFDIAVILTGAVRELWGVFGLTGGAGNVFAGFIAVGVLAALFRRVAAVLEK